MSFPCRLIVVGSWIAFFSWIPVANAWKRDNPGTKMPLGVLGIFATFIVWLMWAGWHLQYFLYLDTYVKMGLGMFPVFALGILAGAIILTWLYNETQGSVFIVAIWHTVFDLLSAAKISEGTIAMIMSIGVMVWAVVVLVWFKPKNLARAERHTL